MTKERTFIAIKPDGVQRGYVSEIIGRFEKKGFKLVGLKQLKPTNMRIFIKEFSLSNVINKKMYWKR